MTTLGLSFGFHDACAAIAIGGEIVAAMAEERVSAQKHDNQYPELAIQRCLDAAGLSEGDIYAVAYYESPENKFSRIVTANLAAFPASRREWNASMSSWLSDKLWTMPSLKEKWQNKIKNMEVVAFEHHQSHAMQAYLGSGFQDAAVLVVDAVGEWATTSIYSASAKEWKKNRSLFQKPLYVHEYPHSLGLFYSAMTSYLGFQAMNDGCSLMALAPFGEDKYLDFILRDVLRYDGKGVINVNSHYLDFNKALQAPWTRHLQSIIGMPRDHRSPLPFSNLDGHPADADQQNAADIAASVQAAFTRIMVDLAELAMQLSGSENLCLAGGAALNCVTNRAILQSVRVKNLFVPIDPGDGGAAAGAALYNEQIRKLQNNTMPDIQTIKHWGPYLGGAVDSVSLEKDLQVVSELPPKRFKRYQQFGDATQKLDSYQVRAFSAQHDLVDHASSMIADGKIIGWFQGRSELGPRALGARSILFRPDNKNIALKVSNFVKKRAEFRPYALSMTQQRAAQVLTEFDPDLAIYRYMQIAAKVEEEYMDSLACGIHIDGTTRPQVVFEKENPLFHDLIVHFEQKTGIPALINTSFNESGYPIVETALDALIMFVRTHLDAVYFENQLIYKV